MGKKPEIQFTDMTLGWQESGEMVSWESHLIL